MIDFNEELKKFKPMLEAEDVESSIKENEIQDIMDLLSKIVSKQIAYKE